MGVSKFSPASQRGVDTTPTASSTNLVESGGVKSAITNVESDLASIHATGSTNTTGAAITAGTYFYLDGVLVRAKADIAVNATYTSGTNYTTVTAGGLNAVNGSFKYVDVDCQLTDGLVAKSFSCGIPESKCTGICFMYNDDLYYLLQTDNKQAFVTPPDGHGNFTVVVKNGSTRKLKVRVFYKD